MIIRNTEAQEMIIKLHLSIINIVHKVLIKVVF